MYTLDLILNFFMAFEDKDKKVQVSLKVIAINYLKGWFVGCGDPDADTMIDREQSWFLTDLLAVIPFEKMEPDCAEINTLKERGVDIRSFRYMRLLRFLKLVRLLKYNRAISRLFLQLRMNQGVKRMLLVAITCFFLVHLMACLFFLINFFGDFPPDGWVVRGNFKDSDPSVQYLSALDWAFQTLTTVGYGSVLAGTYWERFFNLIWMLFGVGFYSFTIGNLSSIIASIDVKAEYLK